MSTVVINSDKLAGDVRVYLMPFESSTGTPDPAGYVITDPAGQPYRFTVPDAFVGDFEVIVVSAGGVITVGPGGELVVQISGQSTTLDVGGAILYHGFVNISSTTQDNRTSVLPRLSPIVGRGVGLTSDFGGPGAPGGPLGTVTSIIQPEASQGNICSGSGSQMPGYVVPANSDSALEFTLPGGAAPTWPADVTPANDPNVDLTRLPDRMVMFNNPFCNRPVVYGRMQIRSGKLILVPPDVVLVNPSIYNMEVIWTQGGITYQKQSIVSVEQSLLNRALVTNVHGPLTLSRIRTKMRDWPESNDLLGVYEFSVAEIVSAMLEPIEYYNETPPHSVYYNTANFPYRNRWLDATVAKLLVTSGIWMMRNQSTIQAQGLTNDTRDKYFRIIQLGNTLWEEYKKFCMADKAGQSAYRGYRSMF